MHVRQQIREAFLTRLAGLSGVQTLTGARAHLFAENELPAVSVVVQGETMLKLGHEAEEFIRDLSIDVTVFAVGDRADDTLDDISAEIERLIRTATGDPWDQLVLHDPVSAEFTIGEAAEKSLFTMQTRFAVQLSAVDAETVGNP